MDNELRKRIEELVRNKTTGDDIYCELIKQKLLYDYCLN